MQPLPSVALLPSSFLSLIDEDEGDRMNAVESSLFFVEMLHVAPVTVSTASKEDTGRAVEET